MSEKASENSRASSVEHSDPGERLVHRQIAWPWKLVLLVRLVFGDRLIGKLLFHLRVFSGEELLFCGLLDSQTRICFFDGRFYANQYPGTLDGRKGWAVHYLAYGQDEGKAPGPLFDTRFYKSSYPDVCDSRINPLTHYVCYGLAEMRDPHPLFSNVRYLEKNPDVRQLSILPMLHFLVNGESEGRSPHPLFDAPYYSRKYRGKGAPGENRLIHFLTTGWREGLWPNPAFDVQFYTEVSAGGELAGRDPLSHYVTQGANDGFWPHPHFDPAYYASVVGLPGSDPGLLAHFIEVGGPNGVPSNTAHRPIHVAQEAAQFPLSGRDRRAEFLSSAPLVSIIVPVYNAEPEWLKRLIGSVRRQTYSNWELLLIDDGSENDATVEFLRNEVLQKPGRSSGLLLPRNRGISVATNIGLHLSKGEFACFLDHDDELSPDALMEVVRAVNKDPNVDVMYTDSDKLDVDGWLDEPFYKPAWSPEYLRHVMYVGHLLTVRRELALQIGGMSSEFDGVQDFEFMLRLSEGPARIQHIPKVLYHWRRVPGSIAAEEEAKRDITRLQAMAVDTHLQRSGLHAIALPAPGRPHRLKVQPHPRSEHELVSIIVPTRDEFELVKACLESVFDRTTYSAFEVIVVDNGTRSREALALFERLPVQVVPYPESFNYSRANNLGAGYARGRFLVLLNNDTEVITGDWLEQMTYYSRMPDVGAVGAQLLYPDGSIQHAGVAVGMQGTADHYMRGFPGDADGYFGSLISAREVSAVTAACLMVKKEDYELLGGLREEFRLVYQDADFCLRLLQHGRRNIYTPQARLIHRESSTRGGQYDRDDRLLFQDLWQSDQEHDPFSRPEVFSV